MLLLFGKEEAAVFDSISVGINVEAAPGRSSKQRNSALGASQAKVLARRNKRKQDNLSHTGCIVKAT